MDNDMDVRAHNRRAWNCLVASEDRWTVPVTSEQVAEARAGNWSVVLTPTKPVPSEWFGSLASSHVLGLASAGGQQCPLFAAAGARVTVFDNSPGQLGRDREVAERDGLEIECVEGDMADLSVFADDTFDLIFHPVSNCFVEDVRPVWREAHRVLRPGGALLAGFCNPAMYMFDDAKLQRGELEVRHAIPYSDLTSLTNEERRELYGDDEPLSFGHTLTDQIAGQLDAGLVLTGFYEDCWGSEPLDRFMPSFVATRAIKP
jgi:SAM-dependent methyltransferase